MELTTKTRLGKAEKQWIEEIFATPWQKKDLVFTAKERGKIVGIAVLRQNPKILPYPHQLAIGVKPQFRRQGFGSAIVEEIRTQFSNESMIAFIDSDNFSAKAFAEKVGFSFVGNRYVELFERERFLYDKHGYLVGSILPVSSLSASQIRKLKDFCDRELSTFHFLTIGRHRHGFPVQTEYFWDEVSKELSFVLLRKERIRCVMLFSSDAKKASLQLLFSGCSGDEEEAFNFQADVMGQVLKEYPAVMVDSFDGYQSSMISRSLFLRPTKQSFSVYIL